MEADGRAVDGTFKRRDASRRFVSRRILDFLCFRVLSSSWPRSSRWNKWATRPFLLLLPEIRRLAATDQINMQHYRGCVCIQFKAALISHVFVNEISIALSVDKPWLSARFAIALFWFFALCLYVVAFALRPTCRDFMFRWRLKREQSDCVIRRDMSASIFHPGFAGESWN